MTKTKNSDKEILYYKNAIENFRVPISEQITALMSFLNSSGEKINKEERDLIELTIKSCRYTAKMVDMVSDIYKIDNGNFKLRYEEFYFRDLVDEVVYDLRIILKYEQLEVKYINGLNFLLYADRKRLYCAIENIFLNLFNYSIHNTVINIEIKKFNNRLLFELTNKGKQITKSEQDVMFERYKFAPSCFCASVLDIGMYLTKEIISAHFGQLILKSDENKNSFGFILPLK